MSTTEHAPNSDIIGRDNVDDIEAILSVSNVDVDEVEHIVKNNADTIFTWDYSLARPQLRKLYEKAKTGQWNATTDLPWERMGGRGEIDTKAAWVEGRHPASMSIDVLGSDGVSSHASIGNVWAFHLSRLAYQFSSSIDGMEVAFSGGAVVTNHPEFKPYVVVPPSDRGGPGPRFAATIPSLHPTASSETGAGELKLDIEMVHRTSLASTPAYEVRRGWSEPYGTAIADNAGIGLEASEDWTVYPGRLDLLTDYVGWVPDPTYGTSEAVWHTNGEVIEFTLQLASLDVTTREVLV